jgi:hypothetical protein
MEMFCAAESSIAMEQSAVHAAPENTQILA